MCTGLAVTPGHKGLCDVDVPASLSLQLCVVFVASESLHGGGYLEDLGPVLLLVRITFQRKPRGY